MALVAGTRIGHYEVTSLAGVGGMGEVYRARDTRLNRDVAVKLLPPTFSADLDRTARFQREAQVLAALNHPNIGAIYGLEEAQGTQFLILELVDGETLDKRIARGPIPVDEAIGIASQIADALTAAHEKGIVHRDLKPSNISLTRERQVKVLDFGLAKLVATDPVASSSVSMSPTITSPALATGVGVLLGTAAYMSPEQARGQEADTRADIWAFGVVLYEMLTGARLFEGSTVSDTLASVLKDTPGFERVPGQTRRLLRSCLAREPKRRLQAIGDWRLLLDDEPASMPTPASRGRAWAPWAVAATLAVVAGVAMWGWLKSSPGEPRTVGHFHEPLPNAQANVSVTLSPDASRLVVGAGSQASGGSGGPIYIRSMDQPGFKPVAGGDDARWPAFSPDGQSMVSLFPGGQLRKTQIGGGAWFTLVDGLPGTFGGGTDQVSWGDDDNILFISGRSLMRVHSSGGKPETLATVNAEADESGFFAPQLLPGGKAVLLSVFKDSVERDARIQLLNLETRSMTTLVDSGGGAQWVPLRPGSASGFIVYARAGTLFAMGFDAARLRAGPSVPMLNEVRPRAGRTSATFNVSATGTLAYVSGSFDREGGPKSTLVWVNSSGDERPVDIPARNYQAMQLSPDGERVVLQIADADPDEIVVFDLTRSTSTPVAIGQSPVWTHDGKRILYMVRVSSGSPDSSGVALAASPADGSAPPITVLPEGPLHLPESVSPDGNVLIGSLRGENGGVWTMPLRADRFGAAKPEPLANIRGATRNVTFSPDGKWVAYGGDGGAIFVSPYPGPGERFTISTDGGAEPRWSRDGKKLFYRTRRATGDKGVVDKIMVVDVQTSPAFRATRAKMLFEKQGFGAVFDVAADGHFLMIKRLPEPVAPTTQPSELHVIVNWIEELRRRVPPIP